MCRTGGVRVCAVCARSATRGGAPSAGTGRAHHAHQFRLGRKHGAAAHTHDCLAIRVARKLGVADVIDVLSDLFIPRGVPAQVRSDIGPEFVAKAVLCASLRTPRTPAHRTFATSTAPPIAVLGAELFSHS